MAQDLGLKEKIVICKLLVYLGAKILHDIDYILNETVLPSYYNVKERR